MMFYSFPFDKRIKFSLAVTVLTFLLIGLSMVMIYDAHAQQQQGGSATSGSATGGAATAGGITISGSCYQCILTNAPQATGGEAASGAATGGNVVGQEATEISTFVDRGNNLLNLGMYTQGNRLL